MMHPKDQDNQRRAGGWLLKAQRGLTLLELTVVMAILGILAALTAGAVTGQSGQGRATSLTSDIKEVEKAVQNYSGQHPSSKYPTLNGCLPGQTLNTTTKDCDKHTTPADPYTVDDPLTWEAIIWHKAFRSDGRTLRFVWDFLEKVPKHGYEHTDGTLWSREEPDPDGIIIGTTPCPGATTGKTAAGSLCAPDTTGSQDTDTSGEGPVWVLDTLGKVHVRISPKSY